MTRLSTNQIDTLHKFMLVNTSEYDGCDMQGESSIFLFSTPEEGYSYGVTERLDNLKVGERVDCADFNGAFIIRLS